jgi:hypothetical protein
MAHLLSVGEVVDRALGKIGQKATRSSGARAADVEEARYWLDMLVGHQSARQRWWPLVPGTATFTLTAGDSSYDLMASIGATQAPNGIAFVIRVILYNLATGQDIHEIPIVRRQEFELRNFPEATKAQDVSPWTWDTEDRSGVGPDQAGPPNVCYITRDQNPVMHLSPAPDALVTYGVRVLFQSYSQNAVTTEANDRLDSIRSTWNLWLVTALAAQIGNGPVRKLPADEVRDMKQEARDLRTELEAYDAHENQNRGKRIAYTDF